MARHLKTRIISRLSGIISYHVPNTDVSASPARGVRYFVPVDGVKFFWGAMNTVKEGRKYKKHIVVRTYPRHRGVLQLYTYHFPKTWSAACVANREIIKTAQKLAHALEHDTSRTGLEWHIRFLKHYFRVFKGGAKPEPGLKPYSRFYQYTYVCIYRELKAAQAARQSAASARELPPTAEDIAFDPIDHRPLRYRRTYPLQHVITCNTFEDPPPPVSCWHESGESIGEVDGIAWLPSGLCPSISVCRRAWRLPEGNTEEWGM
jgi:hypothetical protein